MMASTRLFKVPYELGESTGHAFERTPDGILVSYSNRYGVHRQRALVCAPTVVFVRSGIKRLESRGHSREVHPGELVLLPRGRYMMTELLGGEDPYTSTVLSVEDAFLRAFHRRYPEAYEK